MLAVSFAMHAQMCVPNVPASRDYRLSVEWGEQGNRVCCRCRSTLRDAGQEIFFRIKASILSEELTFNVFDRSGRGQVFERRGWHSGL